MTENTASPTNFIRQIVEQDLASGKYNSIHTRFPPEPNGYLHLGHAKSICLNFGIAQDYQGQCNLRFDDTNPVKENREFIRSIEHDVQWLGFKWNGKIRYSSDYFEQLFNYAIELINKGLAYVDELSVEEIRKYRGTLSKPGKNSPYRDRTIQENLKLFQSMRNGDFEQSKACLRAKIDMNSKFIVMRDPVLYRIKFAKHHQTDNQWCIYPMYDFTHCISDAIEGITHSFCTLEFQDNRQLYNWILNNITISKHPQQYEFSRLNLEYGLLSKRKLTQLVDKGIVESWDDPRMLTISGLRRRGYTPTSIREFCRRIGITKQDNLVQMALLESCIRDDLNKTSPRAMAVLDPVIVILENLPIGYKEMLNMPNHPNISNMGTRSVPFSRKLWIDRADFREKANKQYKRLRLGKEIRLRNAYIIRAERIVKDQDGNITAIYCVCDLDTLGKDPADGHKVKGVIHWVSMEHALSAEFRLYNNLFNVANPDSNENFLSTINLNSLEIKRGFVEPMLKNAVAMVTYQFEREGYFCVDSVLSNNLNLVFNRTVTLRNSFQKN
ncbi:glutamine--tRNA ligase [Candidatus Pantoea carbekii]|uniref:glutamine--tRNA ligase n=1 Tax=Candidatus Pantoea carbekii TaxID=1235990 RepID=UPI0006187B30|nr:glutamine--tRNA ligase [Candidatus Pantoea carbekii]AKC32200.1 glutaminyl-tRNA synthetase [Candidatus Pantoea carbekii]